MRSAPVRGIGLAETASVRGRARRRGRAAVVRASEEHSAQDQDAGALSDHRPPHCGVLRWTTSSKRRPSAVPARRLNTGTVLLASCRCSAVIDAGNASPAVYWLHDTPWSKESHTPWSVAAATKLLVHGVDGFDGLQTFLVAEGA